MKVDFRRTMPSYRAQRGRFDLIHFTVRRDKTRWHWTMMILASHWITEVDFRSVLQERAEKREPPARLTDLRLATLSEGNCVQTLHVGSYDSEAEVLAQMHQELIPGHGLQLTGRHHEIYLSDPRRTAPDRLRTILRQPVRMPG